MTSAPKSPDARREERVHVGAVEVEQRARLVQRASDLDDVLLEEPSVLGLVIIITATSRERALRKSARLTSPLCPDRTSRTLSPASAQLAGWCRAPNRG